MAATNPFRVSDLIAKYGWTAIVYLAALGIENLAEAQILFVDSAHSNAQDADDTEHGHSFEKPLATWDYAVGLCTAGERSVILLAPTHNEELGNAQVDIDVEGVRTIGIGAGGLKPTIDFDNANSSINFAANYCSIENVNLLPAITSILIGVHVEANVVGSQMKKVDFLIGEDGAGADEFIKAVELTDGNDDTTFEDVKIRAHASASQATHGIHIVLASDRLTFKNVIIDGPYTTGGIVEAQTGVDHIVEDCSVDVSGTNYSFEASSTFAKRVRNLDAGASEDTAENLIGRNDADNVVTTAAVVGNADGSVLERLEIIQTYTDTLETAVGNINNTVNLNTAVPAVPTSRALQDILEKDGSSNWDQSIHSLEAIGDDLALGTGATTAIDAESLDKLIGTSDTDQEYPASVVSHSILADIMSATGVASTFARSTDSLEAISVAIAAITDNVATAVPNAATDRSLQDILNKNDSGGFDDATDSLEAIADRLIDAKIDLLTSVADGGGNAYPDSVVQESVIAYILSKSGNPINTSYNNTTDSLEAIRDHLDGTTVLGGIQLDHLLQSDTTVAADADLTTYCADGSIMSHIMSATASTITYKATTDSLEAIAVALAAGTGCNTVLGTNQLDTLLGTDTGVGAGSDLVSHCVNGSIMAHILSASKTTSTYDCQTDSLEAIGADNDTIIADIATAQTELNKIGTVVNSGGGTATIGGCFGDFANSDLVTRLGNIQTEAQKIGDFVNAGGTAELGDMLGDFANVTLVTRLDAIDTVADMGTQTVKVAGVVLTGGDVSVFTIATGPVKIKSLFLIIATPTDAAAKVGFSCTPTAGAETDLTPTDGAGVDINAVDAGDIVYSEMDDTIMIIANTDGGEVPLVPEYSQIVPIGIISLCMENSNPGAGVADVYIQWEPLAPGATLVATP